MESGDDLRAQLAGLAARVASLEEAVSALRRPGNEAPTARTSPPATPAPSMPAAPAPPMPGTQAAPSAASPRVSLESRIGGQLLNRVGILAVLIGVAWFLKLAFDRNWISPPIRVLTGLLLAAGLTAWSEGFRRRGFPAFSYSLKGLGTGIAYLSLWAASSLFHLAPTPLVFLAMFGVTAANAGLAWLQPSELLALYALGGGLATPRLLDAGLGNQVFLFGYLLLLNAGALFLAATRGWSRIAWAALLGTIFYSVGWTLSAHARAGLPVTLLFVWLFFAVFAFAPLLRLQKMKGREDRLSTVAFPIANAAATSLAFLLLYAGRGGQDGRFWWTLLLGIACLGMAIVARRYRSLFTTWLGLGSFFIAAAGPLQFDGYVLVWWWLGAASLLILAARAWGLAALRIFGGLVLLAAALALLWDMLLVAPRPLPLILNMQFATALAAAAVFATVVVAGWRQVADGQTLVSWTRLAGLAGVAFSLTLLVAVSLEIHHYWFCGAGFFGDFCTGYGQLERRSLAAGFGLSAWWLLYGGGLMAAGFRQRSAFLRWQALVVLAGSIGKIFLSGVTLESQIYRVLSFLGLGVVLLAVSFAYQRDWLRLRG